MSDFVSQWMRWLGIADERVADAELAGLFLTRPGLFWIALGVCIPLMVWIVWRQRQALKHKGQGRATAVLLGVTRCGLLLAAAVLLGGPTVRYAAQVQDQPIAVLLVDHSASMGLPLGELEQHELLAWHTATSEEVIDADETDMDRDQLRQISERFETMSRQQATRQLIDARLAGLRERLGQQVELRAYAFNQDARLIHQQDQPADQQADQQADENATGADAAEHSDLLAALQRAARDAAGRPIAGVLVLGDGRWTGSHQLAQRLSPQGGGDGVAGLRLWAVPTGAVRALPDAWVQSVIAPPRVAVGQDAAIVVTIDGNALPDEPLTLSLQRDGRTIDSTTIDTGSRSQTHELTFTPTQLGTAELTVELQPFTDELKTENNRQTVRIVVDDEKLRLLYLDGSSSWDFRFLSRSLQRDAGIQLDVRSAWPLRAAGVLSADLAERLGVPTTADGFAEYDAVLLGDVSGAMLPPPHQLALVEAVRDRGVGLIVQCGPIGTPGDFVGQPLAAALPTRLTAASQQPIEPGGAWSLQLDVTPQGAAHPALRITGDPQQTRAMWSQMPGFYWAARLGSPRPGAQVLAQALDPSRPGSDALPLIVTHTLERGRVAVIGTDATYRWRRNRGDTIFYRFWGQLIRTAARSTGPTDKTSLRVQPSIARVGDVLQMRLFSKPAVAQPTERAVVMSQSASDQPAQDAAVENMVTHSIQAAGAPGHFIGITVAQQPGDLAFTHTDAAGVTVETSVRVEPRDREFDRIDVDREGLAQLAASTGGRVLGPQEVAAWPDELDTGYTAASETFERPAWDHWLTLLLITLVYSVDITARRLSGLS